MSSICVMMLRSEALWFPRFIRGCKRYLEQVMNPQEEDYELMKRVLECENYRQVQTFLKAYNGSDFEYTVQTQQVLAKKAIAREYGIGSSE